MARSPPSSTTEVTANHIDFKIVSGVASRAGALLEEAEKGCAAQSSSAVSQVEDFNIGRVCHKVIQKAQNMAIWVVP